MIRSAIRYSLEIAIQGVKHNFLLKLACLDNRQESCSSYTILIPADLSASHAQPSSFRNPQ